MADTGSGEELIGGIGVTVSGDYSSLAASYATAQDQAQQAGEDIADAFNQGVAGVSDAGDVVSTALQGVSDAAGPASDSLTGVSESAGQAAQSADEAGSSLAEMAEQLAAVGEALVITEGLRELGSEALSASDSITRASIALTTITGSGETAQTTIEGLEQLGMTDGLAMPSLLTAATRMTAMLPPGTDVVGLLGNIADGAAAMGTDIESASQRFDMIVNAGTLSARALTSMGLSLQSVADAMNQVDPSADATTTSVTAMFKAMGQGQRVQVQVLQDALSNLGGTAQQVAQQTFGGQWQQLANQWEQIMVQVGQALLPVVSDLISFTKTDIVPFVQSAVDAFRSLPGPVQDGAVALALVGAALVPLTGALAAGGLAVNALSGLLPALNGALGALGITAGETAAAETAETTATTAMGAASEAASGGMAVAGGASAGLAAIVGGTLAAALIAGAALWADWKLKIADATQSANAITTQFNTWIAAQVTGAKTSADLAAAQDKVNAAMQQGIVTTQQYNALEAQLDATSKSLLGTYNASLPALTILTEGTQKATTQTALLTQALADSQANLTKVSAGYQAGTSTATQLLAAQNQVTSATNNLNAALGPAADSLEGIAKRTQDVIDSGGQLVSSQQIEAATTQAENDKLITLSTALISAQEKLVLTAQAQDTVSAAQNRGTASMGDLNTAMLATEKAAAAVTTAQTALNDATMKAATDSLALADAQNKGLLQSLQSMSAALGPTMTQMLGLDGAAVALQSAMPGFGVAVSVGMIGPLAGLESALAEASAKVQDLSDKMQAGANVGKQYEAALKEQSNAQIALDEESAVLATGLQGATDATSLATVAVAAAQAKLDDLTTAYQNGLATYSQVQQAQKALTTAQTELNNAIAAGSPLVVTQSQDLSGLLVPALNSTVGAANAAAGAIQQVGTAAAAAGAQIQGIAQDLSDMEAAFGSTSGLGAGASSGGSLGGAPPGYSWVYGFFGPVGSAGIPSEVAKIVQDPDATPNEVAAFTGTTPGTVMVENGLPDNQKYYGDPLNEIPDLMKQDAASGGTGAGTSSSTSTSTSTTGTQAQVLIGATIGAIPTSTSTSVPATTTSGTVTASGAGTAAIDGGSYSPVTAHQASGEIWSVQVAGTGAAAGGAGGASSQLVSQSVVNTTIASGDSGASQALQGASEAVVGLVQTLGQVASSVAAVAQVVASEAISGAVISTGGSSSTPLPGITTGSGIGVSGGALIPGGSGSLPLAGITGGSGSGVPTGPLIGSTSPGSAAGLPNYAPGTAPVGTVQWYLDQGINLPGYPVSIPGQPAYNPVTGVTTPPNYSPVSLLPAAGSGASGGGLNANVTVNMQNSNFGANTPTQIQQAVTHAVTMQLVANLRAAGARF